MDNRTNAPRTFSQFVRADLQPRASAASTLPAPTATREAFESSERLLAALRRDTVRAPAPHTNAVLADIECTWE